MSSLEKFVSTLKAHHRSVTKTRRLIFSTLAEHESMTMSTLVTAVQDSVDRASVYRTVGLFEELGIVQRVQMGWKYRLELSDSFNPHHHHIHCSGCGRVVSLAEDSALERHIHRLAQRSGFRLTAHQLELSGLCKRCSKKELGVDTQF